MAGVVTGWGKCVPPAAMTNDDMAAVMDTSDEWIVTRTGIRERRIAHVGMVELAHVAAAQAQAAAGLEPDDFDGIIVATASPDSLIPNAASRVQLALGNTSAAALDVNVGCCGFVCALALANGLIATGVHQRVLVVGAERLTPLLDWTKRDSAILFGDGAGAVLLEANGEGRGLLGAYLDCDPRPGESLMVGDLGTTNMQMRAAQPFDLHFDGREVFRNAVPGMVKAARIALERAGTDVADIAQLIPHQANLRIVEAVGKKLPMDGARVFTNLQRYGNTSAASIPLALCEALEAGRVQPGDRLLFAAFGAGLTSAAAVLEWGDRAAPLGLSNVVLPPCAATALELIDPTRRFQEAWHARQGA